MAQQNLRLNRVFFLVYLLIISTPTTAFWRLLCQGNLGVGRIDPIRSFGNVSQHAHTLFGSSNVGLDSTVEDLMAANCTSCSVIQDRSAYWAPAMYFNHSNGTIELVSNAGGLTAYYFVDLGPTGDLPVAFPPGFKMISGNSILRDFPYPVPDPPLYDWNASDKTQAALNAKALGFNCLNYTPGYQTEGALQYHYLRNKTFIDANCADGVRAEVEFPSCWNGRDLDSPDHQSHIQFPDQVRGGNCPPGFPYKTAVLFYEIIWNTQQFVNFSGQFTFANGDPTGYGYHGDFMSGWNETFLQNALNTCTSLSGLLQDCPIFTLQDEEGYGNCKLTLPPELVNEDTQGPMTTLPGNMLIDAGPGPDLQNLGPHTAATTQSTDISASETLNTSLYSPTPTIQASTSPVLGTYTTTSVYTSAGTEIHLVVVQEDVIVYSTVTVTVAAPSKRHSHGRRAVHNGLAWP